ncbi:MAG: MBL fold metallo-hydrolase [Polyangiaceae bacterium]|nr:MBL fold metallo-hydrolase [Polyangiaceae bacterium]
MEISFLGAASTVTGSKYLVTTSERRILVECGLFQGLKELRLRNWAPLPIPVHTIDAVVLTHAHMDHSGYLPSLRKQGFTGKIFCTAATLDLCGLLLRDSGSIQEEDAAYANKKGFSKHHPALPLYTQKDAEAVLHQFSTVPWEREHYLGGGISVRFSPAGHILGAAIVTLQTPEGRIVFSGDLGRMRDPIMRPPVPVAEADWLVIESTYGDRLHENADPEEQLAAVVRRVTDRGGVLLIPAFAVGRSQLMLYYLHRLKERGLFKNVPVFLNSPMAANVGEILCEYHLEHALSAVETRAVCNTARIIQDVAESRALNERRGPMIIVSASGMLTGGRILHHLKAFGHDPKNGILLAGYQAPGTRGGDLVRGAKALKIHGGMVPILAEVFTMDTLSAHADQDELMLWLRGFQSPPKTTFITHGEPPAAATLAQRIEKELGWSCDIPTHGARVTLEGGKLGRRAQEAPNPSENPAGSINI